MKYYILCTLGVACVCLPLLLTKAQAESVDDLEKPSKIYEHCMVNAFTLEEQKACAEREIAYQSQNLDFVYQLNSNFPDYAAKGYEPEEVKRYQAHDKEFLAAHQLWLSLCDSQMKFYNSLDLPGAEVMGLIWKVHAIARRVEYLYQFFDMSQLPGQTQLAARP